MCYKPLWQSMWVLMDAEDESYQLYPGCLNGRQPVFMNWGGLAQWQCVKKKKVKLSP
jgi:hypothetical protein